MSQPATTVSRPAQGDSKTVRPRPAALAQRPPRTVRVAPSQASRPLGGRALATSRFGYDHSWIGVLLVTVLLLATHSIFPPVA